MADGIRPPQQQRSRETSARLLAATLAMLETHGLDGATIPRIARAAGVAPASVYRRFEDQDALYRSALLDVLERSALASRAALPKQLDGRTLASVVKGVVVVTLQQYRAHPGLMRALTRYVETTRDEAFRARAMAIVASNFQCLIELVLAFRGEITHRNPRRAVTFALLTMATIVEVRALEQVSVWHQLLPLSDAEFIAETTRTLLRMLRAPAR